MMDLETCEGWEEAIIDPNTEKSKTTQGKQALYKRAI